MSTPVLGRPAGARAAVAAAVLAACLLAAPAMARGDSPHAHTVTLYASPTGSGRACRLGAPCSLTAARAAVRALRPAHGRDAVTVRLQDGTYRLGATWRFTAADSGAPGRPVVWTAAPGAHPVISGASRVDDWSPAAGDGQVWQAQVPAGSASRQLYVDGQEVPVAQRSPAQLGFTGGWHGSATGYDLSGDPAAQAFFSSLTQEQLQQVEFSYPGANGAWTQSECRVHSYAAGILTMDQPCWQNVTARLPFSAGSGGLPSMSTSQMPAEIENAQALLSPGQWFLDTGTHTLFFDGPQSMAGHDVELPHLQALVQGAGSLSDPVHDITLSGLQFSDATWNAPSDPSGFADVQSNLTMTLPGGNQGECTFSSPAGTCPWGALTQPLANVAFSGADDITISGDRFQDLGGAGLGLEYGDSGDTVTRSLFDHIASTALLLGCTSDPTPTDPADAAAIIQHCSLDPAVAAHDRLGTDEILQATTVTDNVIEHVGTDYPSACGITLLFSRHTTIAHNDIFDVPYTAITAGVIQGHVDDQTHEQNSVNVNGFNTIADNLIHDYMQVLNDGGAMYIEGHQAQYVHHADGSIDEQRTLADGMQAVGNVAYNKVGFSPVMYDDAGSEYIDWRHNVAFKVNGNDAQGGCDPSGPFGVKDNLSSGPFEDYFCLPAGVSITSLGSGNATIPDAPGPNDLPSAAIDRAGVPAAVAASQIAFPTATYVSPESAADAPIPDAVLIGGEGLNRATPVTFSGRPATKVTLLSAGFEIATVPAGADPAETVVGRPLAAPTITSPAPGAVGLPDHDLAVSGAGPDGATVSVQVDGAPFSGCEATVGRGGWSCTLSSIADGVHTLTAVAALPDGQTATSTRTLVDVGGVPPATDKVNDTDPSIDYSGGWSYSSNRGFGDFQDDVHFATANGETAGWSFIGTGVKVYGEMNTDQGEVSVSVDGGPAQTVDTVPADGQRHSDQVIFSADGLSAGQHTITVTKQSGTFATLDAFESDFAGGGS